MTEVEGAHAFHAVVTTILSERIMLFTRRTVAQVKLIAIWGTNVFVFVEMLRRGVFKGKSLPEEEIDSGEE